MDEYLEDDSYDNEHFQNDEGSDREFSEFMKKLLEKNKKEVASKENKKCQ